jgi:3-phenylpropionate/cinnamic acid dioxygenase small subunit
MSTGADAAAEIARVNARVAAILDHHDYDELRQVLAEDVHYVSVGREFHDVDAVVASFRARATPRVTRHTLGNALVDVHDDGTATGWSVWTTFAASAAGTPPRVFMVADFADRYVHSPGGAWLIAERIITPVFRDPALAPPP